MNNKRLTTNGISLPHAAFLLLNFIGVAVTLYLTKHYFDLNFPTTGLGESSSLCDISSFFNCDAATFSSISNIAGIPIAILGLLIHLIFLGGSLFPSENVEATNKTISAINALGCVVLFFYSIFVLKSLCPFCTVYYVLSILIFILFMKYSSLKFKVFPKPLMVSGGFLLVILGISYFQTQSKMKAQDSLSNQIIKQFYDLKDLGEPEYLSPLTLTKASDKLADAPIWILEFSDFQCPFCQRTASLMDKVKSKYKGQINVHYYPYPLDNACNPKIKKAFHPYACKAAYLASCNLDKFKVIHDEIFANQASINDEFLKNISQKYKLDNCTESEEAKNIVEQSMAQAASYNVRSTPTLIINGKKIEGAIPLIQFYKLFDDILAKKNK